MLFDFHDWQNGKRAGAVHATYMIYGAQKATYANANANGHSQRSEDVEMTSSPPEATPVVEEVPLITLSLVAEENLTGMNRSTYHMYNDVLLADPILQTFSRHMRQFLPSISTALVLIQSR